MIEYIFVIILYKQYVSKLFKMMKRNIMNQNYNLQTVIMSIYHLIIIFSWAFLSFIVNRHIWKSYCFENISFIYLNIFVKYS